MKKKIAIIGGGPGGYVAAIRAAQLGAETTLIERAEIGGACLNVGCIPTKTLLHTAHEVHALNIGAYAGLKVDNVRFDWSELQKHKVSVVGRLKSGIESLLKANKVKVIRGSAKLIDVNTISVVSDGKESKITSDKIIIATGAAPTEIPNIPVDGDAIINSNHALSLKELPKSMAIIGGGVIGCELAQVYVRLGCEVTIFEAMTQLLPGSDADAAKLLLKALEKDGVKIHLNARITTAKKTSKGAVVTFEAMQGEQVGKDAQITVQKLLVAVGRKPVLGNLGLDEVGVLHENGFIKINDQMQTNIEDIYAVGDCNGQVMLAHAASAQGVAAVEHAMEHPAFYNKDVVPSCVYTSPEIGAVGITEQQAKERGISYYVGNFPLMGNGKSLIEGYTDGFVKLIFEKEYDSLIGAHIIGPSATELIAEVTLAMNMEATVDDILATIHAHPSVNEAIMEAALDAKGGAIHWMSKK